MNKDEILEMSRKENKFADLPEKDIQLKSGNAGAFVALILATIFFTIRILVGGGVDLSLYAIVFSIYATGTTVKALKTKRNFGIFLAVISWFFVIVASVAHIYHLISTSSIL